MASIPGSCCLLFHSHRFRWYAIIALLVLTSLGAFHSTLQAQQHPPTIPLPRPIPTSLDPATVTFFLITVGLGPDIHARYGHSFIKVSSPQLERTLVYNWGMFSFHDPLFPWHFYLGNRTYWVANMDARHLVSLYKNREDRNVWQQQITLTTKQKQIFIQHINTAIAPQNMFFNYEHFYRNCATIPRDLLDRTLGGYLKSSLSPKASSVNYRYYVTEHMGYYPLLGFLLDVAMNSKLDGALSYWQESFYPIKLSQYLSELEAIDDEGRILPHTPLLQPSIPLVQASSQHLSTKGPFALFFLLFWLALWTIVLLALPHITTTKRCKFFFRLTSTLWALLTSLIGTIMLISWLFSTHYDMHHNYNLWLFLSFDMLLVLLPTSAGPKITNLRLAYIVGRLLCLLFYPTGALLSLTAQDISTPLLYLFPLQIIFFSTHLLSHLHLPRHSYINIHR